MRKMEFKMERTGLLEVGDILPVTEGKLPNSYYYTLGRAYAMSANYKYNERLQSREGKVIDVKETEKSYIFRLVELKSHYSATHVETLFNKSKRLVLRKNKEGHAMRIWSDENFTFYPYQAGVPYWFKKVQD